jgi:hypothetical protein
VYRLEAVMPASDRHTSSGYLPPSRTFVVSLGGQYCIKFRDTCLLWRRSSMLAKAKRPTLDPMV